MSTTAAPVQTPPASDPLDTMIAMAGLHGASFENFSTVTDPPKEGESQKVLDDKTISDDPAKQLEDIEKPAVTDDKEGEDKPAIEATEKPKEQDEIDRYLAELDKKTQEPETKWSDDAKAALKTKFGTDDPDTLFKEYNELKEQVSAATEKAQQAQAIKERIEGMPYELAQAVQAVADGKPWKPFLEQLSKGITLSKAGKDIDDAVLMNHYKLDKKFSAEQLEAIQSGEADNATKGLWDQYVDMARSKHDESRDAERQAIKAQAESRKAMELAHEKANIAAVAHLKSDPAIAVFAKKDVIDKFISGELETELFYNADGTRKPESLAPMLRAVRHDEIVRRVREGALVEGKTKAEAKAHAKLPGTPGDGAGQRGNPKPSDKKATDGMADIAEMMGLPPLPTS